jgi:hypothetical protein
MPRIELTDLERIALSKAAGESIPRTNGWRDIETAPKDKDILLYCHDSKSIYIGQCWTNYTEDDNPPYYMVLEIGEIYPTHWQPLPEPPTGV